jgi:hypothetical protein
MRSLFGFSYLAALENRILVLPWGLHVENHNMVIVHLARARGCSILKLKC